LRLGIIADAHLSPSGTRVSSSHTEYENTDTMVAYRLALRRCLWEDVDGVALPGDLSQSGDDESLEAGVKMAAESGLKVWAVAGDHDCSQREDALAGAIRRVGADTVRLVTPKGEAVGGGPRVAGLSVTSGNRGYAAGPDGKPDVSGWEVDPVVWLTHFPMISFSEQVSRAGLIYGNDLEDLEEVAQPLLGRSAPTVVVNGHIHLRNTRAKGKVLQVSCAALLDPPFEVTLLDLEPEGDRLVLRRESVALVPSLSGRVPTFSPPRQEWVFEAGAWRPLEPTELRK
jgi:predicted phosphodiesterase